MIQFDPIEGARSRLRGRVELVASRRPAGGVQRLAGTAAAGLGGVPALALAGLAVFTGCHMTRLGCAARPQRLR